MADTTKPALKEHYNYVQEAVDEQAILDKYNAATAAQFAVQREQNRQNENAFYNQMYNTQKTAMDTIRQSNAAAVSTGASRGVQAANELSALLGLQQESVQSATELAQANRQTAQEETAAMLENVLKAYQQAQQERSQLVTQSIEASAVEAEKASAAATAAQTDRAALQSALETGTNSYLTELANQKLDYSQYSDEGNASLNAVLDNVTESGMYTAGDWKGNNRPVTKTEQTIQDLEQIIKYYGLDYANYANALSALKQYADTGVNWASSGYAPEFDSNGNYISMKKDNVNTGKAGAAQGMNTLYNSIINRMRQDYIAKGNTTK